MPSLPIDYYLKCSLNYRPVFTVQSMAAATDPINQNEILKIV